MEGAATLFVPDSPTALDLAATRLVLPAMAAADHPITSFVLCIQLQPADARPAVEALIRELGECTPFRFHNHDHQEDTEDPRHPHFKQIEFRQLESAQKAYATVQGVQLRVSLPEGADSAASPIYLSLSVNQDPALDVTPPAEGTLLHVSELPPSYCSPGPLYELFKPFGGSVHAFVRREKGPVVDKLVLEFCPPRWDHAGPIYRIETGPRLGTARVTYYNKESSRAAEEDLHYSDLDGVTIIVRKPSIHDAKDSFKSSFFPIMPATSRRTFSSPSSALVIPDFVDGHLAGPATRDGFTNAKKAYNYASGHRATCGIGPVPYGLSAKAEPFTPRNPSTASENHPASQTQLKEASPNPLVFRSVSQPIKLADPCQLILQNVPLSLNAQSLYSALRNTLLTAAPEGTTVKLLEATVASDTATGISQGIGIIRLENKSQTDIAMKVLDRAYLVGYEEEGALPLQVKLFEPKGLLEHALQQRQERQSLSNTKEQTHLASPSMVSSISTPSTTTSNSKRNKHRNLLSTVLNDLDLIDSKSLFTSDNEKNRLLDLLMEKLPEDERKRCILEEKFLIKRCSALKMLFWDDEDNQVDVVDATNISDGRLGEVSKVGEMRNGTSDLDIGHGEVKPASGEAGSASPTQVYDGKEDPSSVSLHPLSQDESDTLSRAASPTTSAQPLPPMVSKTEEIAKISNASLSQSTVPETEEMKIETLVRFSVKGIMELACTSNPPALLKNRNEEIVKSVNSFLKGIEGLKVASQKQKIGEKIFKVFKARAAGMKNISKKTVTLLDTEDLPALLHLGEEYPDVLVAKAMAMKLP